MTSEQAWAILEPFALRYGPQGPSGGARGPLRFVREVLHVEPDRWQRKALVRFGAGTRNMSFRSSHGVGKTALLAWMIVYQLIFRFPQKIAATAPTSKQLYNALFAEVKTWMGVLPQDLQDLFNIKSDLIEFIPKPALSFASFQTSRAETPEAIQGVHQTWVLLIVDEASGVPEPIFEAAIGSMAGANRQMVLAGNPVRTSGRFFDTHHKLKGEWYTLHIHGDKVHPFGIYTPRGAEVCADAAMTYGRDSNAFRVRAQGEFPRSDLDTIIPYELVIAAMQREGVMLDRKQPVVWGLDVAWKGTDRSALAKRRGNTLLEKVKLWKDKEAMELVGLVKAAWDMTPLDERPITICVDAINYGAAIASRLQELGLPVQAINVAEVPALDTGRYANQRTELWFLGRAWFERRDTSIPADDEDLLEDLVSTKYEISDSSGKVMAEPKKKARARGFRSPDAADAFLLTFASTAATALFGGPSNWNEPVKRNHRGIV